MDQDGRDRSGSSEPISLPRQGHPKSECHLCVNQFFTAGGLVLQKHGAESDPTAKLTILSLIWFLCALVSPKKRGDLHKGMTVHQEFIQAVIHLIRKKKSKQPNKTKRQETKRPKGKKKKPNNNNQPNRKPNFALGQGPQFSIKYSTSCLHSLSNHRHRGPSFWVSYYCVLLNV